MPILCESRLSFGKSMVDRVTNVLQKLNTRSRMKNIAHTSELLAACALRCKEMTSLLTCSNKGSLLMVKAGYVLWCSAG